MGDGQKFFYIPNYLGIQWFVTDRCNLSCLHCYQTFRHKELSIIQLKSIFKNLMRIKDYLIKKETKRFRLSLIGGEPFLRKDIFLLIKYINSNWDIPVEIATNGTVITKDIIQKLKDYNIERIQVSLDGVEKTNDFIRGNGVFKKVINSIVLFKKVGLKVGVTLTLSKINKKEVILLIDICDGLGVDLFVLRRFLPVGKAERWKNLLLEPQELEKIYQIVTDKNKFLHKKGSNLHISFSCDGGIFSQEYRHFSDNRCILLTEGHLTILANGDIYPCRRLPFKLGNALKDELTDIFLFNKKLNYIRNLNNTHEICRKCSYFETCLSGARCVSYAWFRKVNYPDPQCWRLFNKLPSPNLILKNTPKSGLRVHPNFLINFLKVNKNSSEKDKIKNYSYNINLRDKIERNNKIPYTIMNGKVFLITSQKEILNLNKTASFIWELCDSKVSVGEILKSTSKRFNITGDKLQKDIFFVLKQFAGENLIKVYKE